MMNARLGIEFGATTLAHVAQSEPDLLVRKHLGLVRRIAHQVHWRMSSSIEVNDLIQIGNLALTEAARSFEDRGEAAFSTYATLRIRGAMIDQLRKAAHSVRSAMRRRREFAIVRRALQNELYRNPTDAEMAARVDMSLDAYCAAVQANQYVFHDSIDDAYSDGDIRFADEAPSAYESLEEKARRAALAAAIAGLPEREAMVLQLYFVEELSLEAIGDTLGVGAARICQIKKIALDKVRASLGDWIAA